jgi:hypothetical protein
MSPDEALAYALGGTRQPPSRLATPYLVARFLTASISRIIYGERLLWVGGQTGVCYPS